jgi:hypothetical protein
VTVLQDSIAQDQQQHQGQILVVVQCVFLVIIVMLEVHHQPNVQLVTTVQIMPLTHISNALLVIIVHKRVLQEHLILLNT